MKYEHSFNIGTIRLINNLVTKENWEELKTEIKTKIVSKKPMVAIGSGGNINKIFSLSKTKDGKPLSLNMLKTFYKDLKDLTVEERMAKYRLREDRADVLVPALEIFNKVLSWKKFRRFLCRKFL
jgi:exopolyphosphatase/guanosine-5'-triphosphate,3'-diphosphate pyrophosphatase